MARTLKLIVTRWTITFVALVAIVSFIGLLYAKSTNNANVSSTALLIGAGLVVLLVGLALAGLAYRTDLLRDSCPVDFGLARAKDGEKLRRPFSLALTQMAWWFFLVFAAYIYLRLTGGDATITTQALTLMGIGTGTALGAAAIEQTKTDAKLQEFQSLVTQAQNVQTTLPAGSRNPFQSKLDFLGRQLAASTFFVDILTDVDGVTLHRFQMLVWTLVLGCIFVAGVLTSDCDPKTHLCHHMPSFDPNLLALLGISGGAYLGFKIPEQPA